MSFEQNVLIFNILLEFISLGWFWWERSLIIHLFLKIIPQSGLLKYFLSSRLVGYTHFSSCVAQPQLVPQMFLILPYADKRQNCKFQFYFFIMSMQACQPCGMLCIALLCILFLKHNIWRIIKIYCILIFLSLACHGHSHTVHGCTACGMHDLACMALSSG